MTLRLTPVTLREANVLVSQWHRHHGPARGCRFCVAVIDEAEVFRGVAIVSRPVARKLQDRTVAEVVRLATDGTPNACSMLYSACWRAWRAIGGRRMLTYTLKSEPGTSLRAAGWKEVAHVIGGSWNRGGRPRTDKHPLEPKRRWEVAA